MSKNYAMKAATRDRAGKGVARALRRESKVPAVIYGDNKPPTLVSLSDNLINLEYRKGHMLTNLCDLDVDGQKHLVLVRDIQLHPVSDRVEHVDFLRVTPKTLIKVDVPVHFINQADCPGIKEKGVLNVVRYALELMCTAVDIPEQIDVDLKGKGLGDTIRLSDAKLPPGATSAIKGRNFVIATIQTPRAYVEAEITAPVSDEAAAAAAAGAAAPAGAGKDAKAPAAAAAKAPAAKDAKK